MPVRSKLAQSLLSLRVPRLSNVDATPPNSLQPRRTIRINIRGHPGID